MPFVRRVVSPSCAFTGFVLLFERGMASFFGLPRPPFLPGRMSRTPLQGAVTAVVEHVPPAMMRRRPNPQWLLRILCATAVVLLATTASATTLMVTNLSDSTSSPATGSLRAALSSAMPGDTINIALTGTIMLAGPLPAIAEDLTITGPGASSLTISGNNQYGVFTVSTGTVNISGLTIAKAHKNSPGGAISNSTTLTVNRVIFNQDVATSAGGAIYNTGTLTVSGSTFSNNQTIGASSGGAIWSNGTLSVSNSIFSGNLGATNGGAILNSSGTNTATVTGSFFFNNSVSIASQGNAASFTGGAIQNSGGTLIVSNSTFVGNSAPAGEGGAIANGATLNLSNNTFVGNTSTGGAGGAIVNTSGTLTLNNSILSGNGSGTGAGVDQTGGTVDVSYNVFYQNLDSSGAESDCVGCSSNLGAIDANPQLAPLGNYGGTTQTMLPLPGSPTICAGSYSLATSGTTQLTTDQRGFPLASASCSNGGADIGAVQTNYLMVNTSADSSDASCGAICSLRDAIQQAESAGAGDIAFASSAAGTITLGSTLPALTGVINIAGPGTADLTVSGGGSATVGSVLSVRSGAQIFLSGLTVANGNANSGGGILNSGTLTVTSSAFTSNSTPGNLGGAIENTGTLTVDDSTFSANSAGNNGTGGAGGAIDNGGTLAAANSTFIANSSGNDGGAGGALYSTGTLTVSNSTFVGNSSANGGGVGVFNGTATIANSIFAHNTSASAGAAVFTPEFVVDAYNNLFFANIDSGNGSESDCFNCTINSGSISGDPMLAALGNYGGTTQSLLPLPGSAAICAGLKSLAVDASGNPLTTDQRGFTLGASSSTYCSVTTVDAGAVQTDYTSIQFTNIPGGGAYSAIQDAAPNPLPIVSVTENSQNVGSVPVTLTDASHTSTGLGPVTTVANTGATFSSLKDSAIEDTTLSATLPITSTYSLKTVTTAEFDVTTSTLTLTPTTLPSPTADVAYSQTLSASGGSGTYTYALTSGSLPTGFMLSPSGVISGISTTTNLFSFTVTATDGNNSSLTGSQAYTLTAAAPTITLTPTTLPSPTLGVAYNPTLSAKGGIAPYTYSISVGALPTGLTLNSTTGVISGAATAAGTFSFTVTAKDSDGFTTTQSYSTKVNKQASQTTVSASPSAASPAQTVTLTAVVSATIAGTFVVPTGTATFLNNGTQVGTGTLSGGTATLVVPSLSAGATSVITATYAGDGDFLASTSSNSTTVVVSAFDFTFTNTGTAAYTAAPGAAAPYNFALAPLYGSYAGPVNFRITGLPTGATASFTPSTVAVGGGATPVVMTVQTASAVARDRHDSSLFGRSIVLTLLFLPFAAKLRVREKLMGRMLLLVLLMAGMTATLTGCGSQNSLPAQSPQTYTLTVIATSGTVQHSQTVTLIVQ
jgi:CSLREA domain-containing protein